MQFKLDKKFEEQFKALPLNSGASPALRLDLQAPAPVIVQQPKPSVPTLG